MKIKILTLAISTSIMLSGCTVGDMGFESESLFLCTMKGGDIFFQEHPYEKFRDYILKFGSFEYSLECYQMHKDFITEYENFPEKQGGTIYTKFSQEQIDELNTIISEENRETYLMDLNEWERKNEVLTGIDQSYLVDKNFRIVYFERLAAELGKDIE